LDTPEAVALRLNCCQTPYELGTQESMDYSIDHTTSHLLQIEPS